MEDILPGYVCKHVCVRLRIQFILIIADLLKMTP